jgi:2-C-methyl-D-erythritol 2,4-cyclodiphosphate synthase
MSLNIAELLGIDQNQVSVKATTTEHLGIEGRGEGISAQCVCMVSTV